MNSVEEIWAEKYRSKTLADIVLPPRLTQLFESFLEKKFIPNLLLIGSAGIGKTTTALALVRELNSDYILINGSLDRNIDTIRNDIISFASSVSFNGERKYVIIDEADNLNAESSQLALRGVIEEYSSNCGFIFTGNIKKNLCEPLLSRLTCIDFTPTRDELPSVASRFLKSTLKILEAEGVEYEKLAVIELIKMLCPDWRQTLIELQKYGMSGKIDSGILVNISLAPIKGLVKSMKHKKFEEVRKWVAENSDRPASLIFRSFYDHAASFMDEVNVAQTILLIGKYQYQAALVADQEINTMAFLTEVMVNCDFKTV